MRAAPPLQIVKSASVHLVQASEPSYASHLAKNVLFFLQNAQDFASIERSAPPTDSREY